MRKQELIHIHCLLAVTRRHLAEGNEVEIPAAAFETYDSQDVRPTAIAKRKDVHAEAIGHLLDGFAVTFTAHRGSADGPTVSSESPGSSTSKS
ncbi:UPF0058 family protein [Haloarcula sp. JP-L23]|uniref:UPF0058 family protein n=1 Tax=Haloarcula sp. JP-L23 TaxID=2716717 RepID=UPI00140F3DCE|nr:hypothetical protein G9465_22930 [Haloarcula sp. JP-L23]